MQRKWERALVELPEAAFMPQGSPGSFDSPPVPFASSGSLGLAPDDRCEGEVVYAVSRGLPSRKKPPVGPWKRGTELPGMPKLPKNPN